MSAVVCGNKRSFFEDIASPSSPPSCKKIRRCSPSSSASSPAPAAATSACLDRLLELFPLMEPQFLERALEECGDDLEAAIRRLHELCLGPAGDTGGLSEEPGTNAPDGKDNADGPGEPSAPNNPPLDGAGWVDIFVKEMMSATSMEDARDRATRVLEVFEQSISGQVRAEAIKSFQKENVMLKEQMEVLFRDNAILKRAVAIQHERQKEYENKNQELQHFKQLVSQYQEQLRVLEVNNYALTMHLREAQKNNSFPGRFNPDVF